MTVTNKPFLPTRPLPDLSKVATPQLARMKDEPNLHRHVSVRYVGDVERPNGRKPERTQITATAHRPSRTGNDWYQVDGSLLDALRGAQLLAREREPGSSGERGISSATVVRLDGDSYALARNMYADPYDDDMAAYISMPVDIASARDSDISYPYIDGFDPRKVTVRFNDPRVVAVVGDGVWATPAR